MRSRRARSCLLAVCALVAIGWGGVGCTGEWDGFRDRFVAELMIRKLRDDWPATRGGRVAWKAFHDTLLSFGARPSRSCDYAGSARERGLRSGSLDGHEC